MSAPVVTQFEASGGFHRDSRLGGILHPGRVSLREVTKADSVHISLGQGNRLSVHVDRVCPVAVDSSGRHRYAPMRVASHLLADVVTGVFRLVTGRHHHGRCELVCEVVETPVAGGTADVVVCPPVPSTAPQVPFSAVDEAVHLLDDPAEPWSIQLEVRVEGRLDEARLREAVSEALARHPLARVRQAPAARSARRPHWQIRETGDVDPVRVIVCPDDDALAAARAGLQSRAVPLTAAPPLRVWLARHPDGDVVMLNLNHAAADGFGVLRILRSVARAYAGEADPVPDVHPIAARELPTRLPARGTDRWRRRLALLERARDLARPPARVVPERVVDGPGYGLHHVRLSEAATDALARLDHPGTVNDVLVAALHLAVADWNAEHRVATGRIGVLVAANLRPRAWWDEVVGNFSLFARVSTAARHRVSSTAALDAVVAQTRRKKRTGMGTALVEVLKGSSWLPVRAKRAVPALLRLTGNRMVDTAMLSNLGVVHAVPSFGPDAGATTELWFSPPARMPLGVAVGAATVGGRLHLSFRYRRAQFGPEAARRFAGYYLSALDRLVRLTPGRTPTPPADLTLPGVATRRAS